MDSAASYCPDRIRRLPLTAVAVALVLGVAGCGGTDTSTTDVTQVSTANVSPPDLPDVPTVRDAAGARRDVRMDDCPTDPGAVTANGTVTNSTAKATDYAITVSWVNDRSDVRARGSAIVRNLAPKKSAKWAVKVDLRADNASQCTLFVERGRVTS